MNELKTNIKIKNLKIEVRCISLSFWNLLKRMDKKNILKNLIKEEKNIIVSIFLSVKILETLNRIIISRRTNCKIKMLTLILETKKLE